METMNRRHGLLICLASGALVVSCTLAMAQEVNAGLTAVQQTLVAVPGGGGGSGRSQRVHTTPDAIAPGIIPSAPCIAVYSGGASITGFGLSVGGGVTDEVCQGGNLAAVAAGVYQATGSQAAAEIADGALARAFAIYMADTETTRAVEWQAQEVR